MRGRPVALTFWSGWCEPSLEQLRELRRASEAASGRGPMILAIGDGESADSVSRIACEEELPCAVIPDPAREISRRFVVSLWPSTVWIGANMRVEAVSLGLTSMGGYAPGTHDVQVKCRH